MLGSVILYSQRSRYLLSVSSLSVLDIGMLPFSAGSVLETRLSGVSCSAWSILEIVVIVFRECFRYRNVAILCWERFTYETVRGVMLYLEHFRNCRHRFLGVF